MCGHPAQSRRFGSTHRGVRRSAFRRWRVRSETTSRIPGRRSSPRERGSSPPAGHAPGRSVRRRAGDLRREVHELPRRGGGRPGPAARLVGSPRGRLGRGRGGDRLRRRQQPAGRAGDEARRRAASHRSRRPGAHRRGDRVAARVDRRGGSRGFRPDSVRRRATSAVRGGPGRSDGLGHRHGDQPGRAERRSHGVRLPEVRPAAPHRRGAGRLVLVRVADRRKRGTQVRPRRPAGRPGADRLARACSRSTRAAIGFTRRDRWPASIRPIASA